MQFNDIQLSTISNALRVAAEEFRKHVQELSNPEEGEIPTSLIEQMQHQADAAKKLHDEIAAQTGISS